MNARQSKLSLLLCYTMTSHIGFLHAEVVPGTLLIPVPLPGRLQRRSVCRGGTADTHYLDPTPLFWRLDGRPWCGWHGCTAPAHPYRPLTTLPPPCPTLAAWQRHSAEERSRLDATAGAGPRDPNPVLKRLDDCQGYV